MKTGAQVIAADHSVLTFPSMGGKVVMVTGANDGIGRAAALGFARLSATVVMVCRDLERGRIARDFIKFESGNDAVELMVADLSSQAAIRQLVADYERKHQRLNVPVNNAGVNVKRRTLTAEGLELNFAVNYLAPFLLTRLLIDILKVSAPARVINVASAAEQMGRIDFDDLMSARGYSALRAYSQSKLAMVLFTYELARRLEQSNVTVKCLHPGVIRTKITQGMSGWGALIALLGRPFAAPPNTAPKPFCTLPALHLWKVSQESTSKTNEKRNRLLGRTTSRPASDFGRSVNS
jgi:NAD(P)-dependent dehydrogenase (short-subunit alcohol dehydrogenase family)